MSKFYLSRCETVNGFLKFRKILEKYNCIKIYYYEDKLKGILEYNGRRIFIWQSNIENEENLKNNLIRQYIIEMGGRL